MAVPVSAHATNLELDTIEKRGSYSVGVTFFKRMTDQGVPLEINVLVRGLEDAASGNKMLLSAEQQSKSTLEFQELMQSSLLVKQEANSVAGQEFLKANMSKAGVVTTQSGLQYKVIKEGKGATPNINDTVVTNYEGRLINGQIFDSSYKRNTPATFPVKGVIKGWTEALQLMKTGAKWQLYIPAELAYGSNSRGRLITPDSTLIFDIELLEIKSSQ